MAGYTKRELEAFVSGRSDIEANIETLERRLGDNHWKEKHADYKVKLKQLNKLQKLACDLDTIVESDANGD